MSLRFLQIGLGSMGKRRIRNLLFHGISKEHIFGFDIREERRKEVEKAYGVATHGDFEDAVAKSNPDVFIVSTLPNKHHEYFLYAAKLKKHFFVEATTSDKGYRELFALPKDGYVAAPSCTMRYFHPVKMIKQIVSNGEIGNTLSFTYHLGQYLPDWHPWEDYRKVYFSKKETGAVREMLPFELVWLTDALGIEVQTVSGFIGKISRLDMSADDVAAAVLRCADGVIGTVMIEVLARAPLRELVVIGTDGSIEWRWMEQRLRVYTAGGKEWREIPLAEGKREKGYVTTEDMYREEMKVFLDAVQGNVTYPYRFEDDYKHLRTLFALEESVRTQRAVAV